MARMEVDLEIHAPGLDLHHERWNYHVMFMDEVHQAYDRLAALAWESYKRHGPGCIYVDRDRWMTVIRARWDRDEMLFPCQYVTNEVHLPDSRFGALREGFRQMVKEYDARKQFVLCVEHHSANLLSAYLLRSLPTPPDAYSRHFEEE